MRHRRRHPEPEYFIFDEADRIRVKVVKAAGTEVLPGIQAADPEAARPHFEKLGWCDEEAVPWPDEYPTYANPKITLDDGSVIWGYECWWTPIYTDAGRAYVDRMRAVREEADHGR